MVTERIPHNKTTTSASNGQAGPPLPLREIPLSDNAATVLAKRYLRKGPDGQPAESVHEMFWRVASHVAGPERELGGDAEHWSRRFYDLLTEIRFFPNSPTFTGAGTPLGQLAACFVLGIDDDMGRSGAGIFQTLRDAALIQQTGGGNGFSFSRLRPKGALVRSSMGQATGPVGFLRVYDQAFGEIAQGGCVVGETLVATIDGSVPIQSLVGTKPTVYSYDRKRGQMLTVQARDVRLTGRQREVFRLEMSNGFALTATADHPVMMPDGYYTPLGELQPGQSVKPFGDTALVETIEPAGHADVYDLEVPQTHNFAVVDAASQAGMFIHNSRRGANMAVLRVDHPDIRDFITCKTDESAITNFNISVGITDAFMQAVAQDGEYDLINPADGAVWETARAREIFDLIARQAHHNGEPGMLFLDAANRTNPVPHLYELEATNPCHRGDNLVHTSVGLQPIRDLVGREFQVVIPDGSLARAVAYPTGVKPLHRVHFEGGGFIDLTPKHNLILADGSKRMVQELQAGDAIMRAPMQQAPDSTVQAQAVVSGQAMAQTKSVLATTQAVRVTDVEDLGIAEPVYNITVDHELHQFAVNNIISGNCGEQYLGPYENCCLGSINLARHMTDDDRVDWEGLRRSIAEATRFLDDVVEANAYVPAVPQLKEAAHRVRRIGLGIMGLADMMYRLGVRYGSPAGQEFAAQVMEFVRYHTMQTSIELAEERGPFPAITGSRYDPADLTWEPPQPLTPYTRDWGRPALDWEAILAGIRQHGIRNGATNTVAPTGTISTVAGCEGYGCEPVFALAYIRHVNDNGQDLELQYTSPLFQRAMRQSGMSEEARARIVEQVNRQGTCQGIDELPAPIRNTFVVSSDVTPEEHVRMQAAMQAFVDNSLSKTINMPATATVADVKRAYELAWTLGCKGLTVYVTGSRSKVVLETKATQAAKSDDPAAAALPDKDKLERVPLFNEEKKPRPRKLVGKTYRVQTPLGATYVTINENGHGAGQPFEVFLHASKAGSDTAAVTEALGRLISYVLRLASPVEPRKRVKEIARQLLGIGGGRPAGFGPQRVLSLPDGVAQVLTEYVDEVEAEEAAAASPSASGPQQTLLPLPEAPAKPATSRAHAIGDLCPECGQATFVNEEGCRKCYSCGFSEC